MKTAFAYWENRIAPVFDTARRVRVVETVKRRIVQESDAILSSDEPMQKARQLAALEVDVLVCGAISRFLRERVISSGIEARPFVAGGLREVIQAWCDDTLDQSSFSMPGCRGCGRKRRQERHGGGHGKRAIDFTSVPQVNRTCVCSRCGHAESRSPRVSAAPQVCSRCGNVVTERDEKP